MERINELEKRIKELEEKLKEYESDKSDEMFWKNYKRNEDDVEESMNEICERICEKIGGDFYLERDPNNIITTVSFTEGYTMWCSDRANFDIDGYFPPKSAPFKFLIKIEKEMKEFNKLEQILREKI